MKRRSRGFTLMEVMLAIFIISVALISLQAVVSGGLLSAANSVNQRAARELCRAKLELAIVGDVKSGDSGEDENYGFKWSVSSEEVLVGASDTKTEKVLVVTCKVVYPVERTEAGGSVTKDESFTLATAIDPPKEGGP